MRLALAGQFTSKFSGGHHDTKVMNLGRPYPNRPLELADYGAGVTPAVVEKVTTPFYSTRAGNYTGLGLTACSHMVSTLKGKLFISRIPDAGTVVHVKVSYHPLQQASSRR
ncbi:ATP-binding protein [Mesorhizobium sp. M7A.F.Ca.US.001.04.1.1]|nr:ATP-binding protein [Mesorhizobium sp. M7A.F.Ca.US.001.04.2.1]RUY33473.1 ATP-binding protein [Mesorhizobium sp. M7A.F.Ca.US.001.04.1.1]